MTRPRLALICLMALVASVAIDQPHSPLAALRDAAGALAGIAVVMAVVWR